MRTFLDEDFLLDTPPARRLYHEYAAPEPVIDYHCHIDAREIWEDRRFEDITQLWLGGDHYKWRLMRSAGVPEEYITGGAPARAKFQKWAQVLGRAIGNPLYHWSHLELRRYFGYQGLLNGSTAGAVWALCNERLREAGFSARGLILRANVRLLCTTDDPADSLEWHEKLAADASFPVTVLPAFRPDGALNLEKGGFAAAVARLSAAAGVAIDGYESLKRSLEARMDFFHERGCRLSDHALEYVMYEPCDDIEADRILRARLALGGASREEALKYKTALLGFLARAYARRGWAMQLHYGARRDNSPVMCEHLGPDTGFDCIGSAAPSAQLAGFLGSLGGELPRTILYSLNPSDDAAIDSIIGCFQGEGVAGKVQHGSAWWFSDHLEGMTRQMTSLANLGYLAGFIGMLTDSRSLISYPRHEYFRRVLCRLLGRWVEEGQFPEDWETLGGIVRDVCFRNAERYFGFPKKN